MSDASRPSDAASLTAVSVIVVVSWLTMATRTAWRAELEMVL